MLKTQYGDVWGASSSMCGNLRGAALFCQHPEKELSLLVGLSGGGDDDVTTGRQGAAEDDLSAWGVDLAAAHWTQHAQLLCWQIHVLWVSLEKESTLNPGAHWSLQWHFQHHCGCLLVKSCQSKGRLVTILRAPGTRAVRERGWFLCVSGVSAWEPEWRSRSSWSRRCRPWTRRSRTAGSARKSLQTHSDAPHHATIYTTGRQELQLIRECCVPLLFRSMITKQTETVEGATVTGHTFTDTEPMCQSAVILLLMVLVLNNWTCLDLLLDIHSP